MPNQQTNITTSTRAEAPRKEERTGLLLCLCFDVPAAISHITHLRKTSRCLLESLGLSRENTDDVETLIGELSTNVVRHARMESGTYHVSLEFYEGRVVITVIDKGRGFSEDAVLPPGTLRADTLLNHGEVRFGGLGLLLIHAIADRVEILPTDPHGTTVRAEKIIS